MISGLILTSRLESNVGRVLVSYELDPYDKAKICRNLNDYGRY